MTRSSELWREEDAAWCALCGVQQNLSSGKYWRPSLRRLPLQKVAEKTGEVWLFRVTSGAEVTTAGEGAGGEVLDLNRHPTLWSGPSPCTLELCPVPGKAVGKQGSQGEQIKLSITLTGN